MGAGPFRFSYSKFDKEDDGPMMAGGFAVSLGGNPRPDNYEIQKVKQIGEYLIVKIKYLDCKNYEGLKILVYKGCTIEYLEEQKYIDPHFSENPKFHSPIARFEPTDSGWDNAEKLCNLIKK